MYLVIDLLPQSIVRGAGLGLRRGLMDELLALPTQAVDFLELAPENWIGVGGVFGRQFRALAERFPLVCHGLSLSIGSPAPLDHGFLKDVREFLDTHQVLAYTEHLSYCSDDKGHLYDLMPIPFTEEAVHYVSRRIREVQDALERQIGIEHISYYAAPGAQLSELEFINAVLAEADCRLLLDVNNIYVNSVNFDYDADDFLQRIDGARTLYVHIAGHYVEAPDLRVDTHGSSVIEPVWDLLEKAYALYGVQPTLLERDFNFPPMVELLDEVNRIRQIQQQPQALRA
ncbi:MAG: HvfB family MNIO-type RiPP peptide maturase [Pseudomonadales bacterium]